MKRIISMLLALILVFGVQYPTEAYDYDTTVTNNERTHMKSANYAHKGTPAIKWNGKTDFEENRYYYTTSSVTIKRDIALPENSTLEVRKPLKILNGAELTINGDLIVDYDGKVNAYDGVLSVGALGYVHCYGCVAVSKQGGLNADGKIFVMDSGSLAVKGYANISENARVINGGTFKKYSSAKIDGGITRAKNITDELAAALGSVSNDEKVFVRFSFYDTDIMKNASVHGKNLLDVSLEIQDNFALPAYASNIFFDGDSGSYKEFNTFASTATNALIRWMKTNFGSPAGFKKYLSGDYFSNIILNPAYANANAEVPSDHKYIMSDKYQELFRIRLELADKLNAAFSEELKKLGFESVCVMNPLKNGYGMFCAELTKTQIQSLSEDRRFLFLSLNDKKTFVNDTDKMYVSDSYGGKLGLFDWDKIIEEYDGYFAAAAKDDVVSGSMASDKAYEIIDSYTDVNWDIDFGATYDEGRAGEVPFDLFDKYFYNGVYGFHGFWDDLNSANHSVNKNYIINDNQYFLDSYVYHVVKILSPEELETLANDENVILISEGYFVINE